MNPVHILNLIAIQIYRDTSVSMEEMFHRVSIVSHAIYWLENPNIKKRPENKSSVDFV